MKRQANEVVGSKELVIDPYSFHQMPVWSTAMNKKYNETSKGNGLARGIYREMSATSKGYKGKTEMPGYGELGCVKKKGPLSPHGDTGLDIHGLRLEFSEWSQRVARRP
jgi:hypothetical protein